jgi:hypothetical protein
MKTLMKIKIPIFILIVFSISIKSQNICPDQTECPKKSTCCLFTYGYGCCMDYINAVCCADKLHCCWEGSSCDTIGKKCTGSLMRAAFTGLNKIELLSKARESEIEKLKFIN